MKTNSPFFSIITPTLNEEKFYPRLLKNLIAQSFKDFEVIHVDGRSEDRTRQRATALSPRLPSFNQIIAKKRNVSFQRNLGAMHATGRYLLFIDADTQLPKGFLRRLSTQLKLKPADIFTTWAVPDSKGAGDLAFITIINLGIEISLFFESPAAIGVFMGCTKKAFATIGGFPEDVKYGEDEDFVKAGYRQNLRFHIYRQPRYIYSLRRFRKEGTLSSLRQMARKRLYLLTKQESFKPTGYAMGGHLFSQSSVDRNLIDRLDDFLKQLASPKTATRLKKFLKEFTSELNQ